MASLTLAAPKGSCGLEDQRKADACMRTLLVYGDRTRKGWPTEMADYEPTCK